MAQVNPPGDQRQSFRCRVNDGRTECWLKVGSQTISARLLDESTGGFAVQIDEPGGLNSGDTALLLTDAGWFSVRVVSIVEQPAEPDAAPTYRLGLLRLSDATPYQTPSISLWAGMRRFRLAPWMPTNRLLIVFAILLTSGTVLTALYLTKTRWPVTIFDNAEKASSSQADWDSQTPTDPFRRKSRPSHASPASASFDDSPFDSPPPFGRNPVRRRSLPSAGSLSERAMHDSVRRMAGATALTMPEVIQRLQLTDLQQSQIRQLVDQASEAVRQMERESVGRPRSERVQQRTELLDHSRDEALKLLSDQQRAQWDELTAAPKPH